MSIDTDFVVITGINGAGKTHLLEAIENGSVAIAGIPHGNPRIRRFHHSNMQPKDTAAANPTELWNQRINLWNEIRPQVEANQNSIRTNLIKQGIPSSELEDFEVVSQWTHSDIEELIEDKQKAANIHQQLEKWLKNADQKIWQQWKKNATRVNLAKSIREQYEFSVCLSESRFEKLVPLDWNPTDVFQQNFAPLFATYYRQREQNKIDRYYATQENENRTWLSEADFLEKFGPPPWEVVNDILKAAHLPLRVNYPVGAFDRPFELRLLHIELDKEIRYSELSAGEKIIISLAHCLYYAQTNGASLTLPNVLLLDEPDAPLHPTMAKNFMEVIEEVLVRDHGVKVIITTHSPSTVAFAPESAVFRLDRSPRKLVRCSKDTAINVLTNGFATVMPSSRFVIVEAAFDQTTYQQLYNNIQQTEQFQDLPPLVFVRASDQDNRTGGGCSQVSSWAEKLTSSGLSFFRGLLDQDAGNQGSPVVHILNRYSIENYLLDPIAIYANLVELNLHRDILELSELENCNIHLIPSLDNEKLQLIVNAICETVQAARPQLDASSTFVIRYRGGNSVNAPIWLKSTRGHDLAMIIRQCFRNGESFVFSRNLDELVVMLSVKLPEFITLDLQDTFIQLAS